MSDQPVRYLRIRTADLDDVQAVVTLVESAYRGEKPPSAWTSEGHLLDGQRVDATMVRAVVQDPDAEVLVLEDADSDLLGCCELRAPGSDRTAHLGMFAVAPDRQAGGLGRQILTEAERTARELWGAERLELEVIDSRSELISWYERRGYRRTGESRPFPYGDERFGIPRRDDLSFEVLVKDLKP